jgi:hypothetical protein
MTTIAAKSEVTHLIDRYNELVRERKDNRASIRVEDGRMERYYGLGGLDWNHRAFNMLDYRKTIILGDFPDDWVPLTSRNTRSISRRLTILSERITPMLAYLAVWAPDF